MYCRKILFHHRINLVKSCPSAGQLYELPSFQVSFTEVIAMWCARRSGWLIYLEHGIVTRKIDETGVIQWASRTT